MSHENWITAEELDKELAKDKEYQKRRKENERKRLEFVNELRKNAQPILKALRKKGFDCVYENLWRVALENYDAIPILLEHIKKDYHPGIKSILADALSVPKARDQIWDTLLDEFMHAIPDEDIDEPKLRGYKDALAVTLSEIADKSKLPIIMNIIKEKRHKGCRIFFIKILAKHRKKNPYITEFVKRFLDDKDLMKEIKAKFKELR